MKAEAYRDGWIARFGAEPSDGNVALGLAVAEHETRCGDAWPGECNWGAVQDRTLNPDEKEALAAAGVSLPARGADIAKHVAAARAALAAAGKRVDGLHIDSSPRLPKPGFYWVYFRVFQDDTHGASFFVRTLAKPRARAVLERPGMPYELAAAMYGAGYFEGFYKKDHFYTLGDDKKWHEAPDGLLGAELNIAAYAGALSHHVPIIAAALRGAPVAAPRPVLRRGSTGELVKVVQRIVGVTDDGIFGPRTEAAVEHWQLSNHLTPDGIVGPATWKAIDAR